MKFGACGHPLRERDCPLDLAPPSVGDGPWCAVCSLLVWDRVGCYAPNPGRRNRAAGKWGSSKKKRNSANSYKPDAPPFNGHRSNPDDLELSLMGVVTGIAGEVRDAIARVCPDSSRTIRFRHGDCSSDDVLIIGEPWPAPAYQTLDDLHAMVSSFGSTLVQQQANMAQNTIALLGEPSSVAVNPTDYVAGAMYEWPSLKSGDTFTFTVTGVTPSKAKP